MNARHAFAARPALPALLALLALVAFVPRAAGGPADVRNLVVRGRVLRPDGAPLSGASVSARGSFSVTALTDERGRYTLSLPMGSPAGLRRGPFAVEVRAEVAGRRLPCAAGGSALAIEVALLPGTTTARVASNSPSATAAVVTAFAQQDVPTAWAEIDFGGASRGSGAPELKAVDEAVLAGIDPAPGTPSRAAHRKPEPPVRSAPALDPAARARDSVGAATRRAAEAARWETRMHERDSLAMVQRARRTADSVARAGARRAHEQSAAARIAADRARLDSLAAWRSAQRHADSLAWIARHAKGALPVVTARSAVDSLGAVRAASESTGTGAPDRSRAARRAPSRVQHIEAFQPAAGDPAPDTCACRLRGTVEVEWEELPLERGFPVEISFEGPATQRTQVEMFMGSPREFRLGPLPCGEYRLVVRPRGRLRYSLEHGDSVVAMPCRGATQVRLVLLPGRR